MLIFNKQVALSAHLKSVSNPGTTIGFVPTMGALHDGHLSLLKMAAANNTLTVISIFVNPTQFNNPDDLANYPRSLSTDVAKIATVSESIIIFAPDVSDIYEGDTTSVAFEFDGLEHQMEGKFRPGHFDGVGTIVKRFFEIIQPTNAYFGEKDFQQLQIVRKMVAKHQMPVNIIGCPIHRERNGLAMSSRNERLSAVERESAAIIYKTLLTAREIFGTESVESVAQFVTNTFEAYPEMQLEYFEIADEETLEPIQVRKPGRKYRAFIAVFMNDVRLIDTISLN